MNATDSDLRPDNVNGWLARPKRTRFTQLLFTLSLLLFAAPFIGTFSDQLGKSIATLLVVILLAVVLISAGIAVAENRRQLRLTLALAGASLVMTLTGGFAESQTVQILRNVTTIIFLAHVVRLIILALFREHRVTYDTIAASLCGYLLIGVVFAVVFALVMEIDPQAIATGKSQSEPGVTLEFGDKDTATSLYFSFVTLTTLGYGDITPSSMFARMLTTAEALTGQVYLVVLVARLVGLHISSEMTARSNRDDG